MSEIALAQEYDNRGYDPPMPVLDIGISRPGLMAPSVIVEALVDTGADATLIPRDILERVGATFVDRAYMRGITGHRQLVNLYLVTLHLGPLRIAGVRAVALSVGETAILGRDALNHLDIRLIGVAGITEIYR
jgi:predicted aspartyl protease